MQERASIVPAEVLYHSRRDDVHHRRKPAGLYHPQHHANCWRFVGDFYRNIQLSILTRGYEQWRNSEANLLITRGLVGRLSNTPNVGFAYTIQGVVDYLTSHGVRALPGRRYSTSTLQGLNWVIQPTQLAIPMQPSEVNSNNLIDGRISLSFSNYRAALAAKLPYYNNQDEEVQSDEDGSQAPQIATVLTKGEAI
ncbi:hypothetical protein ZIOFF_022509 [Zingiber officinale]|uniref:Uncharacterized protein n=1 Tax=Zingiber officinale TaxID=94328 RepID=A0A8J5LHF4_ZINOF|nr:hypothetical protein ZIOFF_022509 [Zingiber officinale]